jgi:hypothetical protein
MGAPSKWDLNRTPSKLEQRIGQVAAAIGSVILGFLSYLAWSATIRGLTQFDMAHWIFLVWSTSLFLVTTWLFLRITLGQSRKLSLRAQLVIGSFFIGASCLFLVSTLLFPTPNPFFSLSTSLMGLYGGVRVLIIARRRTATYNKSLNTDASDAGAG